MEVATEKLDYQQLLWNIIGIAWRRKFWILVPVVIGGLVSVYLVKTLPKIYESSTFIMVEGQKIPQNIVKSAVTGTAEDRLSSIKQQVLSRSFLFKIIEKFGLYESDGTSKPLLDGEKIKKIKKNITVATRGRRQLESFSISFKGEHPETVMKVTNELASLVMEENLKIREEFVEGAIQFLNLELGNLKRELERQESLIGNYKHTYMGELPGQLDSNLRALDRFQANLESVEVSKKATQTRVMDLGRMMKAAEQQSLDRRLMAQEGLPIELSGDLLNLPQSPLEQRLAQRKEALADLLTEYSEDYPDVAILRRNITTLEQQVARLHRSDQQVDSTSTKKNSSELRESPAVIEIRRQIRKANEELNYLKEKEQEIQAKIQVYEVRVENTPKREQELIIMSRDYDNIASNYQTLMNKKLNATISENLEKRQKGEQFRIIDSANFPEKAISPNRILIALGGVFGGFGLGVVLVFCLEQLDNSIRKPEEVERITSVLVLAEIPDFSEVIAKSKNVVDLEKFADRKKRRRRQGMGG